MAGLTVTEGYVPFDAGVKSVCQTYWKKVVAEGTTPDHALIIVHGGPSFGHDYLRSLGELARYGSRCVVFYDQLGCGKSSKIPEKKGDVSFWKLDLYRRELASLISHLDDIAPEAGGRYDLLGHSVGALMSSMLAADRPAGLRKLVLSNGLACVQLVTESNREVLKEYPQKTRDSIIEREEYNLGYRKECRVSEEDYQAALNEYRKDHALRIAPPFPEEVMLSLQNVQVARDSFWTLTGGDVEMIFGGSLMHEDARPILHQIAVPTLVLNGEFDKASPMTSQPFVDLIPNVTRIVLTNTSHFPFYEDYERYLSTIARYLQA